MTSQDFTSDQIQFVISARDLPKKDRGILGSSTQDPYVRWSSRDVSAKDFEELGVTEHRNNEENPNWHDQVFSYDYSNSAAFERVWRFEVFDHDAMSQDDLIGFADIRVPIFIFVSLKHLSDHKDRKPEVLLKLSNGGILVLTKCEPFRFHLSATDLPKSDIFKGRSDPYVKCYWSIGKNGAQTLFATTKTLKDAENPKWEEEIVFPNYISHGSQYLTFKVFDKDPLSQDDQIGECTFSTLTPNSSSIEGDGKLTLSESLNLSRDPNNQRAKLVITSVISTAQFERSTKINHRVLNPGFEEKLKNVEVTFRHIRKLKTEEILQEDVLPVEG